MIEKIFVGIDIGTSSVKALAATGSGTLMKERAAYACQTPEGWISAVKEALGNLTAECGTERLAGIGLSAQVGTYITDAGEVVGWQSSAGTEELEEILSAVEQEEFERELAMRHPRLVSFPLPRLLYIKRHFPACRSVRMPKEILLEALTGNTATDRFSQRGAANTLTGKYSEKLLKKFGLDFDLPLIKESTEIGGRVGERAASEFHLPEGLPVYVGCNDFFAGLIGMGAVGEDTFFDMAGTSEHVGKIAAEAEKTDGICGPFFHGYAIYGGTKAGGLSCKFGAAIARPADMETALSKNPPIFLPYLSGERAPIYDENARGVFFGIGAETTKEEMSYAVLEGVAFGIYDIAERLGAKPGGRLLCGGGPSENKTLSAIKAELFGKEIAAAEESDSSALGAAMLAMVGAGKFVDVKEAAGCVSFRTAAKPTGRYRETLLKRFALYRSLYRDLKEDFKKFGKISGGMEL